MNTLDVYLGGDISGSIKSSYSTSIIEENKIKYADHRNKYWVHWDLAACEVPKVLKNKFGTIEVESVDLVMVKDVIQHVDLKSGQRMLRNAVNAGAKYLVLSSYPDGVRNVGANVPSLHSGVGWYRNNVLKKPFSFPAPLLNKKSHLLGEENDQIFFYKINDELRK